MKKRNIRKVKAKLSQIISSLTEEASVIIRKNGRPGAVLMPMTEKMDILVVKQVPELEALGLVPQGKCSR